MVKIVVDGDERVLVDPALVIKGEKGEDGKDGRDGIDGRDGEQGIAGKDGRDGIDGKDGKDGVSYWIEYDKKKEMLIFKNDAGKKNPDPIKLPSAKGWGFGVGGRGGVTAQSDWNQTDPHAVDFIKNKPEVHNVQLRRVDELPDTGEPYILYLVPVEDPQTSNIYDEYIWAVQSDDSYDWEKLGTTEIDLSGYVQFTDYATTDVGGVFRLSPSYYGTGIGTGVQEGRLTSVVYSYDGYANISNLAFVSKGTLENVITGKGLLSTSDVAGSGHISNKTATNKYLSPSTIDDVACVSARSMYDKVKSISSGTINLDEGCVFYSDSPSAATTYTFNASALTQTDFTYRYFNILITMPSTAVGLDFTTNNNVVWAENETPDMTTGGRTYLLAFQTFDGGTNWVGSLCTWWENPSS